LAACGVVSISNERSASCSNVSPENPMGYRCAPSCRPGPLPYRAMAMPRSPRAARSSNETRLDHSCGCDDPQPPKSSHQIETFESEPLRR
jgi:hypothetical protein